MIILLNGPPRSGKGTIAKIIKSKLGHMCSEYKMSKPLKNAFKELLAIDWELANHLLEEKKDDPLYSTADATPRDIQIALSEQVLKPLLGHDALGKIAVNALMQFPFKHCVISDVGFDAEVKPLQERYGYNDVKAIRISRPDTNYDNDSRSYLDYGPMGIGYEELSNEFDLDLLDRQVHKILVKWELLDE